jgi:RNA polymerase sigma-70 factor, ECF subfamily
MATDTAQWKIYFDEWGPSLLLFARQQTGYLVDAEDVVQEAFIKVWKTYDSRKDISKSLLYTAVRTTAIDHTRSMSRRKIRENTVYQDQNTDLEWFQRSLEKNERTSILEQKVRTLSKDQQEVLILKIWGELTFHEIAETLGISQNTAASRYRYALYHLKKEISPSLI